MQQPLVPSFASNIFTYKLITWCHLYLVIAAVPVKDISKQQDTPIRIEVGWHPEAQLFERFVTSWDTKTCCMSPNLSVKACWVCLLVLMVEAVLTFTLCFSPLFAGSPQGMSDVVEVACGAVFNLAAGLTEPCTCLAASGSCLNYSDHMELTCIGAVCVKSACSFFCPLLPLLCAVIRLLCCS